VFLIIIWGFSMIIKNYVRILRDNYEQKVKIGHFAYNELF
jgi:hypothetical protein